MDSIRLDVGAGSFPKPGFKSVDLYAQTDYKTAMWDLSIFKDGEVDEIYSSHALEHIPKLYVVPTLREWNRVLCPGGKLEILVPDLAWCCEQWLLHQTNDWWMDIIFGNQDDEGQFHKTGFTPEILSGYLHHAGFTATPIYQIIWSHEQDTIQMVTHKDTK